MKSTSKIILIIVVILLAFYLYSKFKKSDATVIKNSEAPVVVTPVVEAPKVTETPATLVVVPAKEEKPKEVVTPATESSKRVVAPSSIKKRINNAVAPKEGTASQVHGINEDL